MSPPTRIKRAVDRAPAARMRTGTIEAPGIPEPAEYRVLDPGPAGEPLPLLLVLHGANSSSAVLEMMRPQIEELWSAGSFPRAIVASVSTPTAGGFYIDHEGGGAWESLVATELPRLLARVHEIDRRKVLLMGSSMGGYGVLKLAFREPGRYAGVAALSPAVFPGERMGEVPARNRIGELGLLHQAMGAGRGDEQAYANQDVPTLLRRNAEAIAASRFGLLLDCGDSDAYLLHDGCEHLHRLLSDLGVGHDYHLVQGADHVGPETLPRQRRALLFLARALERRRVALGEIPAPALPAELERWLDSDRSEPPPPFDPTAGYAPLFLRRMMGAG